MWVYLHSMIKGYVIPINEALIKVVFTEFTRSIDKAVKDRLNIAFARERTPNVKIDVIIQSYGLVGESFHMPHCPKVVSV